MNFHEHQRRWREWEARAASEGAPACNCELRNRQWDPNTGRCGFCGRRYVDERDQRTGGKS